VSFLYKNRIHAGQVLAQKLAKKKFANGIILAIPRGGVVVAKEIASELKLPLDIIVPRKISAPDNPEMAVGAVSPDGTVIYNYDVLSMLGIDEKELQPEVERQLLEIRRRMAAYRQSNEDLDIHNKQVILVDDGIATGQTIMAAINSIKNFSPKIIILATPVAPRDTFDVLRCEVDEVVCPVVSDDFYAVGQFYYDFQQVDDQTVKKILSENKK